MDIAPPWDQTEPLFEGAPCYSEVLKADLLPGTFIIVSDTSSIPGNVVVARVVAVVSSSDDQHLLPSSIRVNIFQQLKEVLQNTEGIINPNVLR